MFSLRRDALCELAILRIIRFFDLGNVSIKKGRGLIEYFNSRRRGVSSLQSQYNRRGWMDEAPIFKY